MNWTKVENEIFTLVNHSTSALVELSCDLEDEDVKIWLTYAELDSLKEIINKTDFK